MLKTLKTKKVLLVFILFNIFLKQKKEKGLNYLFSTLLTH